MTGDKAHLQLVSVSACPGQARIHGELGMGMSEQEEAESRENDWMNAWIVLRRIVARSIVEEGEEFGPRASAKLWEMG